MKKLLTSLTILLLLALASPVWGHAILLSTRPESDAVLSRSPQAVVLQFDSRVEKRVGTRFAVQPQGAEKVSVEAALEEEEPATRVTVPLPALEAGSYHFHWSVISRDGHRVGGSFAFTIE